jgi:photosystem II stability/assembly factor-like uncharacterized protein
MNVRAAAGGVVLLAAAVALRPATIDAAAAGRWEPLGPFAATVFALEVDPHDERVLLAGTYFGGLYRSSDYGMRWSRLDTPFSSRMVLSIAFDPLTQSTVFAGTFEDGIYKSTDGGQSWIHCDDGLDDRNIETIAVDPAQRGTVLVATAGAGVYRSADEGDSWSQVLAAQARAFLFDPRAPGTVLASDAGRVWRSTDHGQTWSLLGAPLGSLSAIALIVDTELAGGYLAATPEGVYRFDPESSRWTSVRANLPVTPIHQIVALPASATWFVVSDDGIFANVGTRTDPAWARWAAFDMEPRRLLFNLDGAVAHVALRHGRFEATLDFGQNWFEADAGMQNLFVGALAGRAVGGSTLLYGGSDLGIHLTAESFGRFLDMPNWLHAPWFEEGIFSIAPHPTQPNIVFAGTERAGVWKSADWGGTWTQSSVGLYPRELFALAQSMAAPATMYAGTTSGIFRSRDGGRTWRATADRDTHPGDVTAVALDPESAPVAYFGTGEGRVFRTLDGERFFEISDGLPGAAVQDLKLGPQGLFARCIDGRLFRANGSGAWTLVPVGVPAQAIALGGGGVVFAGTVGGGMLRSVNGGPWLPSNDGLTVPFVFSIAVDPTNPATVYLGSYLPYRSDDGGQTWVEANPGHDLPFGPITSIVVDRQHTSTIYAAIQTHGIYRSDDRGTTWMPVRPGGADGPLLVDVTNGHVLTGGSFEGVWRSPDGGQTWQSSSSGLSIFARALAIDPANPDRMYAGGLHGGLFRSTDGGASWALAGLGDKWIETVALDPADTRRVYVGTTTGISRSEDGGATWTAIGPPTGGLLGMLILAIAVDPSTPSTLYAATGGYGVWKSTNFGAEWVQAATALANPLVLSLALDAAHPATLYAGTAGGGVFVSDDAAHTWQPLPLIANGFVTSLAIDPLAHRVIYAGTEGGGVSRFERP